MIIKRYFAVFFTSALISASLVIPAWTQEANAGKQPASPQPDMGSHAYRLDYTLTESENGKKIDSRHYSINLGGDSQTQQIGHIEIGTRVPIEAKSDGTVQYIDAGTKITGSLHMRGRVEVVDTSCDVSSVAPEQANTNGRPVLRTLQMNNV